MPPRRQHQRQKQQQQLKQQQLQQQHQPIAQKQSPSQQSSKQDILAQQPQQQSNSPDKAQCDHNTHEQASQAISDEKRKEIIHKDVQEMLENDLNCAICRDIYINPLILNCSHSFCKYCVYLWLSKKSGCPTCRMTVTFQAENLALRNIINRMIQKSSQQYQTNRASVVSQRLKDEEQQQKDGVVPKMTLKPSMATNASNSNQGSANGSRAGGDNIFQLRAFRRGIRRRNLEGMFSLYSSESSDENDGADDANDDDFVLYSVDNTDDEDDPTQFRNLFVRNSSDELSTEASSGDDDDDADNDMDDENEDEDDVYVDLDVTGDSDHNQDDDDDDDDDDDNLSDDSDESVWDGHNFSDDIVEFNEDGDDEVEESDSSSDSSSSSSSSDSSMSAMDDDNSYDASFRDGSFDDEPSSEDSTEEYEVDDNDSDELVISWDSDVLDRYSRDSSVEYATSSDEFSS